jgi:hypothetical protein
MDGHVIRNAEGGAQAECLLGVLECVVDVQTPNVEPPQSRVKVA